MKVVLHYIFSGRKFDYQADMNRNDFDVIDDSGQTAEEYYEEDATLAFYRSKNTPVDAKESDTCEGVYECPVCGGYIGEGAKYCPNCGQRVNEVKLGAKEAKK